jgi:hypothetical protein
LKEIQIAASSASTRVISYVSDAWSEEGSPANVHPMSSCPGSRWDIHQRTEDVFCRCHIKEWTKPWLIARETWVWPWLRLHCMSLWLQCNLCRWLTTPPSPRTPYIEGARRKAPVWWVMFCPAVS